MVKVKFNRRLIDILFTPDHGDLSWLCVHHHKFTIGDWEETRGGRSSLVHTGQPGNNGNELKLFK